MTATPRSLCPTHPDINYQTAWGCPECVRELRIALDASVKLQSHYAKLLNMHDGGERRPFKDSAEWIARLRETGKLPTEP